MSLALDNRRMTMAGCVQKLRTGTGAVKQGRPGDHRPAWGVSHQGAGAVGIAVAGAVVKTARLGGGKPDGGGAAHTGTAAATSMHGRPSGFGHDGSAARCQRTSGRSASQVMPVARSMSGHCSAGTLPRAFHMLGALAADPMAAASAEMLPAAAIACSSGDIGMVLCNHKCDCEPNTNVMQAPCLITPVTTIAIRLAQARTALGKTQGQLAHDAGVSQGTIGNIEAGARKAPRELLAIAKALGVSPEWLKTGKGPQAATVAPQTALPAQDQPALDLTAALGLVLDALAAMPTARWDSVQVQLAKVVRTPEMRDETLSELLFLLNVSPLGGFSTDQEDYAPEKRLSA